ncbi:MAG TPA: hypothetical protein VGI81_15480 [Tepidisphaeraceae bacterium]
MAGLTQPVAGGVTGPPTASSGCPHEEGIDFPLGQECPFCPFWHGKQGITSYCDKLELLGVDRDEDSEWMMLPGEDIAAHVRRKADGKEFVLGCRNWKRRTRRRPTISCSTIMRCGW